MKIGINAVGLYPGKVGGVEQYLRNIVYRLLRGEDMEVYLFLNNTAMDSFPDDQHLKRIQIDMTYDQNIQLKGYIDYFHLDVWFCPFFHLLPVNCGIPNVTTILDIQQEFYPENFDPVVLEDRKRLTEATVKNTELILTISEYSKDTILKRYGLTDDRVRVTYLDADESFVNKLDAYKLFQIRNTLPDRYVLFPANMWPHKNHIILLKGFEKAKAEYACLHDLKLVFTGNVERETEEIRSFIEAHKLRSQVVYLGYLPQDDMRYIFRGADMLAFPSRFEGFGIPLVEAMEMEIPIICSRSSCLPEIAGDAALFFDEDNADEVAEAIYRVHTDMALRDRLVAAGKIRRKTFSWDRCAEETVQAIRSLYRPRIPSRATLSCHPLVSIITPSYNQGDFIRETIESVLNQTYDNIEYIVMDGGSTDQTVDILKEYGNRIVWRSEKDKGQADAVNKGLSVAKGEIIGWLNSDDTYYPDAVKTAVEELLSHPGVDMVYGEGDYIDRESNVTGRYNTKLYSYDYLADECFICQPAAFFTKAVVNKAGNLRADLQLCMDYELWMRIGKVGKILYVPKLMAASRMYDDNKTLSRRREVYEECCCEVKRHFGYVSHSWLVGYAHYKKQCNPCIPLKVQYLFLFLKYNYCRPDYFIDCAKRYLKKRKRLRNPAKSRSVSKSPTALFSDGWMSKEYCTRLITTDSYGRLVIEGEHIWNFPRPIALILSAAGLRRTLVVEKLGPVSFSVDLPRNDMGYYDIRLKATQTGIPARVTHSSDERELSVKISRISIEKIETGKLPLVSVITPSYNQGAFLRDAIESVLAQDYPQIEYIVVDGGSTDCSLDILAEYADRLTYVSEPDHGQSDAINKGFAMAHGEIVAWLNSDDVYEPGCISTAVDALRAHPDVALVYGDGYIIDKNGRKERVFEYTQPFDLWSLVHIWDYIMQPTTFFRKKAMDEVGGLNEELNWVMDWDLWIRLARKYDVLYLPHAMACSREYGETKTSTGNEKRLRELLTLMRKNTGEKAPYGYEIYYLSNRLEHEELTQKEKEETVERLTKLIELQPVPDRNRRCASEVNFMIMPYQHVTRLEVTVEDARPLCAVLSWNGERFLKANLTYGTQEFKLPIRKKEGADILHVEMHSEELQAIRSRKGSWVKMQLIL